MILKMILPTLSRSMSGNSPGQVLQSLQWFAHWFYPSLFESVTKTLGIRFITIISGVLLSWPPVYVYI